MIDDRMPEDVARKSYMLLHRHARNGYDRGDCHCEACDVIVQELTEYFGITRSGGLYSPAFLVRQYANELGWS